MIYQEIYRPHDVDYLHKSMIGATATANPEVLNLAEAVS